MSDELVGYAAAYAFEEPGEAPNVGLRPCEHDDARLLEIGGSDLGVMNGRVDGGKAVVDGSAQLFEQMTRLLGVSLRDLQWAPFDAVLLVSRVAHLARLYTASERAWRRVEA